MQSKHPLITGTIILTFSSLITKLIGFFFRIFLCKRIGAEKLGIYQLIIPFFALGHTICCSAIETAISKHVAESKKTSKKIYLLCGTTLSLCLSVIVAAVLFIFSSRIGIYVLKDSRTIFPLKIIAFLLPLSSIHACIYAYHIGNEKPQVPAIGLVLEQITRFLCLFLLCANGVYIAFYCDFAGELASTLFAVFSLIFVLKEIKPGIKDLKQHSLNLYKTAYPLALTRILTCTLTGLESILIPTLLVLYGLNKSDAMSMYGILTGIAIPVILFPCCIITSLSTMLLPSISKSNINNNNEKITKQINLIFSFCMYMGMYSSFIFINYSNFIEDTLFDYDLVSSFIEILGWLCPFLYIGITFSAIINGLGKTKTIFVHNIIVSVLKITCIIITIPIFGIKGYLITLLIAQILMCFLHIRTVKTNFKLNTNIVKNLLKPLAYIVLAYLCALILPEKNQVLSIIISSGVFMSLSYFDFNTFI